ncbi:MAG: hypothetical protein HQK77_21530, partial [Desulfobacterales bacterium]|nr:hypothetical protein [Desulfobacterales bacterium]
VLSSNFQKPMIERIKQLGARLFIEKPITPEKIVMIIDEYQLQTKKTGIK